MKKALIAMSGGVDSSLAAKLMKDRGFPVPRPAKTAAPAKIIRKN